MRIVAELNNVHIHATCPLCGAATEWGDVVGVFYADAGRGIPTCDDCAKSSRLELDERIYSFAAELRTQADILEKIAASPIELPDPAVFRALQDQVDAEYAEYITSEEAFLDGRSVVAPGEWDPDNLMF